MNEHTWHDIRHTLIPRNSYHTRTRLLLLPLVLNFSNMSVLSKSVKAVFSKYPILRGMVSYGFIWPISSFIQQTVEGKRFNSENSYDWWRCIRFGLYGSCYVAPTLYCWLTIASLAWPATTLRAGLAKTFFETISYTPFAMCSFYFFMSLLESKSLKEATEEVSTKFLPTYKVGASIWPALALINYTLVPPENRVPFISICSLIWTCFLAYMKHLEKEEVLSHSSQLIKS